MIYAGALFSSSHIFSSAARSYPLPYFPHRQGKNTYYICTFHQPKVASTEEKQSKNHKICK